MAGQAAELTWRELFLGARTWASHNSRDVLAMAAVSFGVGWLANVYIMAFRYEGFRTWGRGGAATAEGNLASGGVFWVVFGAVVVGLVSYGRAVGWNQLGQDLGRLPSAVAEPFQRAGLAAWSMLLFGAGLSLAVAAVAYGAAAGILGIALVLVLASPLSALVSGTLEAAWRKLSDAIAPGFAERFDAAAGARATVVGAAGGMLLAWILPVQWSFWTRLALAVGFLVGAVVLLVRGSTGAAAASMLLAILSVLALRELLDVAVALADDGGWRECGRCNLWQWARSDGATKVMGLGVQGATAAALGGAAGAAVGGFAGAAAGGFAGSGALGGQATGAGGSEAGGGGAGSGAGGGGGSGTAAGGDAATEPGGLAGIGGLSGTGFEGPAPGGDAAPPGPTPPPPAPRVRGEDEADEAEGQPPTGGTV